MSSMKEAALSHMVLLAESVTNKEQRSEMRKALVIFKTAALMENESICAVRKFIWVLRVVRW